MCNIVEFPIVPRINIPMTNEKAVKTSGLSNDNVGDIQDARTDSQVGKLMGAVEKAKGFRETHKLLVERHRARNADARGTDPAEDVSRLMTEVERYLYSAGPYALAILMHEIFTETIRDIDFEDNGGGVA